MKPVTNSRETKEQALRGGKLKVAGQVGAQVYIEGCSYVTEISAGIRGHRDRTQQAQSSRMRCGAKSAAEPQQWVIITH